jgi:hypothetical protein
MADVTKIGSVPAPTWATYSAGSGNIIGGPSRTQLHESDSDRVGSGYIAGEALNPWDACFIYLGSVYRTIADNATHTYGSLAPASAVQAAKVDGFAAMQVQAGEAVTLWGTGVEAAYTTAAFMVSTLGTDSPADLYPSQANAGALATAAPANGAVGQTPVARYLGAGRIRAK